MFCLFLCTRNLKIKKVNHKWDQFWNNKRIEHEAEKADLVAQLKDKENEITRLNNEKHAEIANLKKQQEQEKEEHKSSMREMERALERLSEERERIMKEKDDMLLTAKQRIETTEVRGSETLISTVRVAWH